MNLTKLSAHLGRLESEVAGLRTRELFYNAEAVDREIYEIFEQLAANKHIPQALPEGDDLELPLGVIDQDGPTDDLWESDECRMSPLKRCGHLKP